VNPVIGKVRTCTNGRRGLILSVALLLLLCVVTVDAGGLGWLPFTTYDLIAIAVVCCIVVAVGISLRRAVAHGQSDRPHGEVRMRVETSELVEERARPAEPQQDRIRVRLAAQHSSRPRSGTSGRSSSASPTRT
jgi:hypothetical protein